MSREPYDPTEAVIDVLHGIRRQLARIAVALEEKSTEGEPAHVERWECELCCCTTNPARTITCKVCGSVKPDAE